MIWLGNHSTAVAPLQIQLEVCPSPVDLLPSQAHQLLHHPFTQRSAFNDCILTIYSLPQQASASSVVG